MINTVTTNVNSKEYGFKFNMLSLKLFLDKCEIDVSDLDTFIESKPLDGILNMLQTANKVYNKGAEVDLYEIGDVFDNMPQEDFNKIWGMFIESITDFTKKVSAAGEAKKK